MKFLLDANLSPVVASGLVAAGHKATHVRDLKLNTLPDEEILDFAHREDYVVISQDVDFTNLLFYRGASKPSVIMLREVQEVSGTEIAELITRNLDQIREALMDGAVVSMIRDRVRIRRLPIE